MMHLEPLPRRRFLKLGLMIGGCAVATLNGVARAAELVSGARRTKYGNLLVLSEAQARVMNSFAEAVLPKGEKFPNAAEAQIVQRLDEEIFFISPNIADDVKMVLDALDMLPLEMGFAVNFSNLSVEKRLEFLNSTKETDSELVRAVINNCRMITFNLYYGHESSWAAIGYDGPFTRIPQIPGVQRNYYAEKIQAEQIKG